MMSSLLGRAGLAILGVALLCPSASPQDRPPKIGMELWSYRNQLKEDLPDTLATIRGLGFTDVETASYYGHTAAEFRGILDHAGLTCSSIITDYGKLKKDLSEVVADAKALGARYVLTAGFPHKGRLTAEEVHRAASDFNDFGARLKASGLRYGYHPHGFEFAPSGGGTLFDALLAETQPDLVTYELDTYHFALAGANPVHYLKKYPKRFSLVHLKDLAKSSPTGDLSGKAVVEASVVLGTGMLDWPAILSAAKKAGVDLYYIEDENLAAPAQVPRSVAYLKSIHMWRD